MGLDDSTALRLAWAGIITGILAGGMYLGNTLLDLPTFLRRPFWIFIGPLMCVAFIGVFGFLIRRGPSATLIVATIFGVLAGALRLAFSVVQSNNLITIRRHASEATTEAEREVWAQVFDGVFTVQNGINYAYDLFLDWGIILLAVPLWSVSRGGRALAILGAGLAGLHFTLKLVTFPDPPAAAGLLDVGPGIGGFVLVMLGWMAWRLTRDAGDR